ncbi:MAG: hypothetical protein ACYCW6_32260 [Candidatus Xenobia bacterium]
MVVVQRDEVKALYVEPAHLLRPDWPVVVPDADHVTCILKPAFKDGLLHALER